MRHWTKRVQVDPGSDRRAASPLADELITTRLPRFTHSSISHLARSVVVLPQAEFTRAPDVLLQLVTKCLAHVEVEHWVERAIEVLEQGLIDVNYLISGKFSLANGLDAFELARKDGSLKVLIQP